MTQRDMHILIDSITARWTRLGAMFNVRASSEDVDLERLLLDTARAASANTRLLIMAVTWLARYGGAVGKHRLATLAQDELERDHLPTLGLLLDLARSASPANRGRFDNIIRICQPAVGSPRALSDAVHRNGALSRLTQQRASAISRRWNLWLEEFAPKFDALRPPDWVMRHNPTLPDRLLTNGEVATSILAELQSHAGQVHSESALSTAIGVSRPAIRQALDRLLTAGRVRLHPQGRSKAVQLSPAA